MHAFTNYVKLVIDRPKALVPSIKPTLHHECYFSIMAWPCACLMGCDVKWPKEKFGIIHLGFDLGNQHCTFLHAMGHCPMLAHCAKGGTWDNCQVSGQWNYGNPP